MSKNKLIPELRFPEFNEDGVWKIIEVGDVFNVTRGNVLAMNLVQENKSEEFPYPVFSSQTKNNGLAGFYKEFLYENAITWTTDGANAGDVNYRIGKFYCTNVCGVLLNEDGLANLCIAELINSVSKKHVSYIGNPKLMNGVMSKIKIPIPSITEQQKIASCLSSIDEVIEAHSQKLELLKNHKKGLMQNLFPQEDEKVPKFRFPEFEKDGEWTSYTMKDLTKINQGLQIPISERYKEKVENSFFYITNEFLKLNSERTYFIENPPESVRCKEEDVLMTRTGNTGQVVTGVSGAFHNNFFKIQFDRNILNKDFLVYFLKLPNTQHIIMSFAGASTIPDLNHSDFYRISIKIPLLKEQQKIASCLSALDELMTAEADKIEQLQQHKKGLMQGLFPKMNKV